MPRSDADREAHHARFWAQRARLTSVRDVYGDKRGHSVQEDPPQASPSPDRHNPARVSPAPSLRISEPEVSLVQRVLVDAPRETEMPHAPNALTPSLVSGGHPLAAPSSVRSVLATLCRHTPAWVAAHPQPGSMQPLAPMVLVNRFRAGFRSQALEKTFPASLPSPPASVLPRPRFPVLSDRSLRSSPRAAPFVLVNLCEGSPRSPEGTS